MATALITGATSGIGLGIAKELLEQGNKIAINYGFNDKQANNVLKQFIKYADKILLIKADVSNETEVETMFKEIETKFGGLDYLINNAGTCIDSEIENADLNDYLRTVNVNFIGKMLCTKHAIPLLKKSKTPAIVNIASGMGLKPVAESSAYCCAAAGIIMLTEVSALELSKYKIRVNTVCPGFTPTPLSLKNWTKEEIAVKERVNPRGRLAKVEDTVNAVMFLISEKSDYINGQNILVNGGSNLLK